MLVKMDMTEDIVARRWWLAGRVQGVGFRPFVFRQAQRLGLTGWVRNRQGQVEIHAEGCGRALAEFGAALISDAPPLAVPRIAADVSAPLEGCDRFSIVPSTANAGIDIHVPPDYFCCDECLRELDDPDDRRYRYPFINCTQCGPRYTLIERLPYDRPNTAMAGFALCGQCRTEYEDPSDRRFHAEPIACPTCGPALVFRVPGHADVRDGAVALEACVAALRLGRIVAVKGIGGYHLMTDAASEPAVARLRQRKHRPHKPFAVMFPLHDGLAALRAAIALDPVTQAALLEPMRPIVLAKSLRTARLAPSLAPGLDAIGVMLPYSPLHHLLLADFAGPLVATSANISGEPVLTENAEVETRLARVADAFLHHDRPIVRPADDSVFRVIAGGARPLRLGRGAAPLELALPSSVPQPLLAVGGHLKNTVALAWTDRAAISPHIGDLSSPRSLEVFETLIHDLQALYGVRAEAIACDAHPNYASTRWGAASGLPVIKVLHHHAHASALAGEHTDVDRWLVFTWDGVGYGADGELWGGEGFVGRPGQWRRVATMRRFHLGGGDNAGRQPWRSAAALCWETGRRWRADRVALAFEAWKRRVNTSATSAVGRLFDAAAVFVGLLDESSFEGQGPMWLEAIAVDAPALDLPLVRDAAGIWRSDWAPLVPVLLDQNIGAPERAGIFHASLAQVLLEQARKVREEHDVTTVGFAGGVFQNRRLTEAAVRLLRHDGFDVRLARCVPCNDGGISFGQILEATGRL